MKTIIFDFDGTLANCKELHQTAFRSAVKQFDPTFTYEDNEIEGLPTYKKVEILKHKGADINVLDVNEVKQKLTLQSLSKYVTMNQELHDELLRLSKNYKLCLASNATEQFIHNCLMIMEIKDLFVKVNTATDFPPKPDDTTFTDCMRYTNAEPHDTIIFEDSAVGIECARKTGAQVIEVKNVEDTILKMREL